MVQLLAAGQEVYGALLNPYVCARDKGGMASLYRSQWPFNPDEKWIALLT